MGTVDPEGQATTYRFDYGTSASYGLQTAARTAGTGTSAVEVTAAVQDLSPDDDLPLPPRGRQRRRRDRGPGRHLHHHRVAPQPGHPPRLPAAAGGQLADGPRRAGAREPAGRGDHAGTSSTGTPRASASGRRSRRCRPARRTCRSRPRSPASSPAGACTGASSPPTRRGSGAPGARASPRSGRRPASTLVLQPATVRWGRRLIVRGQVQGLGVAGITVALQRAAFPFGTPFADVGTKQADAAGALRLRRRPAARHDALPGPDAHAASSPRARC